MAQLRDALRALRTGGVIAFPTETTYGIGCDPRNPKAVARIYRMKGRDPKKPLLLVASSLAQVKKVAVVSPDVVKIANAYWPGALTLVLPKKHGRGDVAIRVSSSEVVHALTSAFGYPIVATSANRSGEPECRSGTAIVRVFTGAKDGPDVIVDIGSLPSRLPSTVARVRTDGTMEILRQGSVHV